MSVRFICSFCRRDHNCPANPDCHWDPQEHEDGDDCYTFNPDHPESDAQ